MNPSCGRKEKGTRPAKPELGFLSDTRRLNREAAEDVLLAAEHGGPSVADGTSENCENMGREFK